MSGDTFDSSAVHVFLLNAYRDVPGWLQVCRTGDFVGQTFTTDPTGLRTAATYVVELNRRYRPQGVYFRATTLKRRPGRGQRGGAQDTLAVPYLWADIDYGTEGHAGTALPPTEADAYALITEARLPEPTTLIHSGGGLYPLWRVDLSPEAAVPVLDSVQANLAAAAERHGWSYGTGVGDLARVLRVPGSVNRKTASARLCRVIGGTGQMVPVSAFPVAPAPAEPVVGHANGRATTNGHRVGQPGPLDVLARAEWSEILEPAGWTLVGCDREGERWLRPGDPTSEYSARAFPHNLVVHSEAAGLPPGAGQRLTKGRVWAHLNGHGDDLSAAARDLRTAADPDTRAEASEAAQALPEVLLEAIWHAEADHQWALWGRIPGAPDTQEEWLARKDASRTRHHSNGVADGSAEGGSGTYGTTFPIDHFQDSSSSPEGRLGWEQPSPLWGATERIPPPAGSALGEYARALAVALQVPVELPLTAGLPIITTAAQGAWRVDVGRGWVEPLCLAALPVLAPSERKSPVVKAMTAPLRRYERERRVELQPIVIERAARRKLADDIAEARRKAAVKDDTPENQQAYVDADARAKAIVVPPLPRLLCDDATAEALVALLVEHGSIGSLSAEPGLFDVLAGKYNGGTADINWFLQATMGEPLRTDRIGRGSGHRDDPALNVLGCIQPGRLVELGKVKVFRDAGLLSRYLYAVPGSIVGTRGPTSEVPPAVADRWDARLHLLCTTAQGIRDAGNGPTTLRLTEGARREVEALRQEIEPTLHPEYGSNADMADWLGKACGTAVRIAGALTLLDDPRATSVTQETTRHAVEMVRAYAAHARVALGLTRPAAMVHTQARELLAIMRKLAKDGKTTTVTRREVRRKVQNRAWVESGDSLTAPLTLLVEYGHIRFVPPPQGQVGRPPETYELHPDHLANSHVDPPETGAESAETPTNSHVDPPETGAESAETPSLPPPPPDSPYAHIWHNPPPTAMGGRP